MPDSSKQSLRGDAQYKADQAFARSRKAGASQTSKYASTADGDVTIPDSNVNIVARITGWTTSHTIKLPVKTAPGRVTIGDGDGWSQVNLPTIATQGGQVLWFAGASHSSLAGVPVGVNQVIELDTDGDGNWWFIVPNPVEA